MVMSRRDSSGIFRRIFASAFVVVALASTAYAQVRHEARFKETCISCFWVVYRIGPNKGGHGHYIFFDNVCYLSCYWLIISPPTCGLFFPFQRRLQRRHPKCMKMSPFPWFMCQSLSFGPPCARYADYVRVLFLRTWKFASPWHRVRCLLLNDTTTYYHLIFTLTIQCLSPPLLPPFFQGFAVGLGFGVVFTLCWRRQMSIDKFGSDFGEFSFAGTSHAIAFCSLLFHFLATHTRRC